jgi:hypothetical protein
VEGATVLYVGKGVNLQHRIKTYAKFGCGKPVAHWGGRYIWQLKGHQDLEIRWQVMDGDPRQEESRRLQAFRDKYGKLPFANLRS